jgi:hypothetical protein
MQWSVVVMFLLKLTPLLSLSELLKDSPELRISEISSSMVMVVVLSQLVQSKAILGCQVAGEPQGKD